MRRVSLADYREVADCILEQGGMRFRVVSDSMHPALQRGDWVDLERPAFNECRPGDILVVAVEGALRCHRLVRCFNQDGQLWIQTRGDGVTSDDPPVPAEWIIGRVKNVLQPSLMNRFLWRIRFGLRFLFKSQTALKLRLSESPTEK